MEPAKKLMKRAHLNLLMRQKKSSESRLKIQKKDKMRMKEV